MKQREYLTPDEVFESLQGEERIIAFRVRDIVMNTLQGCTEKLSYGAPFYFRHSRICYIWPGSIPWGKATSEGVTIGFCRGNELSDPSWLETANRKNVFVKRFLHVSEIDIDMLKALLFEAMEIDSVWQKSRSVRKSHR